MIKVLCKGVEENPNPDIDIGMGFFIFVVCLWRS
jgi:hypothetical protein